MAWIFDLLSTFGLWGSLALLAWGAALCLEEGSARGDHEAEADNESPAPACAGGRMQ